MDMLFIEAIVTCPDFLRILVDKTDLKGKAFKVIKAELSKSDKDLGESDITVILEIDGNKYGFLIEDKVDAIAMPEQHGRYVKRGEKGVKEGEYKDYRIFIICPEKYYKNNDEAKLYESVVTYEECKDFFDREDDPLSKFRSRQIGQAIKKAKKPPVISVNERANAFLRKYIQYQREYYPTLDLTTKEDKNGYWTDFRTELGIVYINHKIREGYVDLTFPRTSEKHLQMKRVADWLRTRGIPVAKVIKTKNSNMFRILVPKIDIMAGFEAASKEDLNKCFEAIKQMTDFANIVEEVNSIIHD